MGGKSRKTGGISKALIDKIKQTKPQQQDSGKKSVDKKEEQHTSSDFFNE